MAFGLTPHHPSISNILTSMFAHAGILHLTWNMLFLWLFGPNVEDALGRLEYTIFYVGSGFAASLLHVVMVQSFTPAAGDIPIVGASGAIAGILGIFAVRFYRTRIKMWYMVFIFFIIRWGKFTIPAWIGLSIWFGQQLLGGIMGMIYPESGGVAYWSHIGGMVFGMILAYAMKMVKEGKKEYLMADAKDSLEKGTTWNAAEHLRLFLGHDPENAEVHGELAKTYALQQDSVRAMDHYQRSIDLHLRKGERDKAVSRFAELKHFYCDARLVLKSEYQLARYLLDGGFHAPALQLLQDIANSYPGTPEAEVALVKMGDLNLNALRDPRAAIRCFEWFLSDYPNSEYRPMVEKSLTEAKERL